MVDVTLALVDAARLTLSLRRGVVTALVERVDGLVRLEVDGVALYRLPAADGRSRSGDDVLVNGAGAGLLDLGSAVFNVLYAT